MKKEHRRDLTIRYFVVKCRECGNHLEWEQKKGLSKTLLVRTCDTCSKKKSTADELVKIVREHLGEAKVAAPAGAIEEEDKEGSLAKIMAETKWIRHGRWHGTYSEKLVMTKLFELCLFAGELKRVQKLPPNHPSKKSIVKLEESLQLVALYLVRLLRSDFGVKINGDLSDIITTKGWDFDFPVMHLRGD